MGKFFYSWYFIYPTRSKQWHSSKNEKKSYHTRFGIQKDEKGGEANGVLGKVQPDPSVS